MNPLLLAAADKAAGLTGCTGGVSGSEAARPGLMA